MKIHHRAIMAGLPLLIASGIVASDAFAQTQAQATAPAAGSKNVLAWAWLCAKASEATIPDAMSRGRPAVTAQ